MFAAVTRGGGAGGLDVVLVLRPANISSIVGPTLRTLGSFPRLVYVDNVGMTCTSKERCDMDSGALPCSGDRTSHRGWSCWVLSPTTASGAGCSEGDPLVGGSSNALLHTRLTFPRWPDLSWVSSPDATGSSKAKTSGSPCGGVVGARWRPFSA